VPDQPVCTGVDVGNTHPQGGRITGVNTSVAAFIGIGQDAAESGPRRLSSFAEYEAHFGSLQAQSHVGFGVYQFFLNGGQTCWAIHGRSFANALSQLDRVPAFNLLCVPGVVDNSVLSTAADYCEKRLAFLIIDSPAAEMPRQLLSLMRSSALPRSASAAVYGPWLQIDDPLNSAAVRKVPPSGSVAGIFARMDAMQGVWTAPAGTSASIVGAIALAMNIPEQDAQALNELNFNVLREFSGRGIDIWGAHTLGTDPDFKYVNVRRFALFLQQSIASGTQWAVFELNGPPLWAEIRTQVENFLQDLFQQGAFAGSTPQAAYFVNCGETTMTPNDIDSGRVNVVVGFAPLRPAEFVVFRIGQWTKKA
jgi:phage tail sheath protein FI